MEIIMYLIIFLYGAVIGSFLNVCIYRIPNKENIVSKRSHCMSCGNVLKWYELVPIMSYLMQKGACRHCKQKIAMQYPLVEVVNAIIYVWIFVRNGFTFESILYCLCASALVVISVIDWKTFEIPLGCNMFILCLGILKVVSDLAHWNEYVIGFFIVSSFLYVFFLFTKGKGIGGGDIKLMAAAGLLLGYQGIVLSLALGCILGSVIHITRMKVTKKGRVLAFGPYLSMGILITMLYGEDIITWYIRTILWL